MIELVFSDSATASLKSAMQLGNYRATGMKIAVDSAGNTISEEPFTPAPYTGPKLEGSADDVLGIWLLADIGDISNLANGASRMELWHKIAAESGDDNWSAQLSGQLAGAVARLERAKVNAEPVRVWWSDAPGEACGFYWAMSVLKNAPGPVYSVKIPMLLPDEGGHERLSGTGGLAPEHFYHLAAEAKPVGAWERAACSDEWNRLAAENAPLRAVVNGRLCSVAADFYDAFLRQNITGQAQRVMELIGLSLVHGPPGISDWWYAQRIRNMLAAGELVTLQPAARFYSATVKPAT